MARRLSSVLILACAALAVPSAAQAATEFHVGGNTPEPKTGKQALQLAKQLRAGEGVETGRELTPVLKVLAEKLPQLKGAERRSAERMLARPTQGQGNPGEATYTVPEAPPVCSAHYCVHYVASTADAPPGGLSYVNAMVGEFENVYNVENGQLGWAPPVPDGTAGGDGRTDVYIKNIGPDGLYGYAAPDPGQTGKHWAAFLVMDNDYAEPAFTSRYQNNFLLPLQVTAAHEYNHVLHFGYDQNQDSWMFEATATWMEDKVYDDINDYRGYLGEWAQRTTQPLTQFNSPESGESNSKVYGDAVFNRWIDERYGADTIRRAWEVSVETGDFAPGAYEKALREKGTSFDDVFNQFSADTAEWRSANTAFEEGQSFPDVQRQLNGEPLQPQNVTRNRNDFISGGLDHTAYALVNVDPAGQNTLTVGGTLPRRVAGAIALVGRTGDETGGSSVVRLARLPNGGAGKVTLDNATSFSRVTAVIINADVDIPSGDDAFNRDRGDWNWLADDSEISLAVNDFSKPTVKKTSPKRGARRVSRTSKVKVTFSEAIAGANRLTVKLIAPNGRSVPSDVVPSGRTLKISPSRRLRAGSRYTVRISNAVTDGGGNALPASKRTFRFTTGG
jgi:methionine-rich copper-binding protein CopC